MGLSIVRRLRISLAFAFFSQLACNDVPFAPSDPEATLGEDQFWDGVALIHSAAFQDPELVEQIIAEATAFNSSGDTLPCNWWRRVGAEEEATNCSWNIVQVLAGDIKLDTYLADSNTVAAILPETPANWPVTLRVKGWRSELGTVQSYGFSEVRDGPAITALVMDWPGEGAGKVLATTGPENTALDHGDNAVLRYLDLRTGGYEDLNFGTFYASAPFAPGKTWDPNILVFTPVGPDPTIGGQFFWRFSSNPTPIDTLYSGCGRGWRFFLAPTPRDCVAAYKHDGHFVSESNHTTTREAGGAERVKYSIDSGRWISLPGRAVWDFAGNAVFQTSVDWGKTTATEFSPNGDTLFLVSGKWYSNQDDLRRELRSVDALTGSMFGTRLFDAEGPEGRVNDILADPDSPWLYMLLGCREPRLEIIDRATLETVKRIELGTEDDGFLCMYGSLVLSRFSENALYFIMSDGNVSIVGRRSRIYRFEIPAPGAGD